VRDLHLTSKDRPDFELLPAEGVEGPLGLSLLPPASDGDIYFDMKGYPLIDEGLIRWYRGTAFGTVRIGFLER
jgi:hypothetical protein